MLFSDKGLATYESRIMTTIVGIRSHRVKSIIFSLWPTPASWPDTAVVPTSSALCLTLQRCTRVLPARSLLLYDLMPSTSARGDQQNPRASVSVHAANDFVLGIIHRVCTALT